MSAAGPAEMGARLARWARAPAFPAVDYGSRLVPGVSQGQGIVRQITRVARTGDDLECIRRRPEGPVLA